MLTSNDEICKIILNNAVICLTISHERFIIIDRRVDCHMNKKSIEVTTETQTILNQLGDQIKMARIRRQLSVEDVVTNAGISRTTLWSIEKGSSSVAIGAYASVLHVLDKMDSDLLLVAKDDVLSYKIQGVNSRSKIRKIKHY